MSTAESEHGGRVDCGPRAGRARRRSRASGASRPRPTETSCSPTISSPASATNRSPCAQGVVQGGVFAFVILVLLQSFDELETATLSVLAPNIRDSLHVSDGVIVFISAASGAFLVLGALPMGWLADRYRRAPIIGWATAVFSAMVFVVRPRGQRVHPLLGPVRRRHRQVEHLPGAGLAHRRHAIRSPSAGGSNATIAGAARAGRGAEPGPRRRHRRARRRRERLAVGVLPPRHPDDPARVPRLPHPGAAARSVRDARRARRGRSRRRKPTPISIEAAFARLNRIRTFRTMLIAFAAMGFGLFTGPVLQNLYLEDHFGLEHVRARCRRHGDGCRRAPRAAVRGQALRRACTAATRRSALRLLGFLIMPVAVLLPIQYAMPNAALFTVVGDPARRPAAHRVHHGRSGASSRSCRTGCAAWARRSARSTSSSSARPAARCSRRSSPNAYGPRGRGAARRHPVDAHRRLPDHAQRLEHQVRPVAGRRRAAARSSTSTSASSARPGAHPRHPGRLDRLLLRPRAGAVRRRLRGPPGRGARAARNERRRQVDDPAGHRRARARRRAASSGCTAPRSPSSRPSSG